MKILETERLILRTINVEDAAFYLALINSPGWLAYIGDRGIRTLEAAKEMVIAGPMAAQKRVGFSFYLTALKDSEEPIGICGLMKREGLDDVDIGYAFMPEFWGKGYAYESASAVLAYGKNTLKLPRIVAITNPANHASIKVVEKIGLKFEKMVRLAEDKPEINLYSIDF
ncbi:GNAT family N-acetyltransferase [Glaciimonas soli]|uniref:GNAT family N-acetyltransferase n=1 Tax=Glaciimonas soli TaxID=2590999 RepID=A0A843YV85_9BURK|nr:GNAT family N-acetyltransferase [Glaciimonas soli]MQR01614.1 GNAT family N-acetyltransferase [Glaciimonas soli]